MTQDAVVIRLLPNNMAEVAVTRATACGGNCGSCESCMFQSELHTEARNLIQAKPGQKVTIESKSSRIFGAAMLVYIMPLLFFLVLFSPDERTLTRLCHCRRPWGGGGDQDPGELCVPSGKRSGTGAVSAA